MGVFFCFVGGGFKGICKLSFMTCCRLLFPSGTCIINIFKHFKITLRCFFHGLPVKQHTRLACRRFPVEPAIWLWVQCHHKESWFRGGYSNMPSSLVQSESWSKGMSLDWADWICYDLMKLVMLCSAVTLICGLWAILQHTTKKLF